MGLRTVVYGNYHSGTTSEGRTQRRSRHRTATSLLVENGDVRKSRVLFFVYVVRRCVYTCRLLTSLSR